LLRLDLTLDHLTLRIN